MKKVNPKIIVNARFLTQRLTGTQRFAIEISKHLKAMLKDDIIFVSPHGIADEKLASSLNTIVLGKMSGHLWEQLALPMFVKRYKTPLLVNLINTAPIFYKKQIMTLHDIAFKKYAHSFTLAYQKYYSFLIPLLLKKVLHIVTVSEFSKKEIINNYNISPSKISVVYNSTADIFLKNKMKIKRKNNIVLTVASLDPRKNLEALVRSVSMIKNKDIELWIVGNPRKNVFRNLNIKENLKNIRWIKRASDKELKEYYLQATIFIFPSLYEGFGLPPLEAQACGVPVISSNAASMPEVLGDSVLYCDPYNVNDIRDKILLLLNDKELQNKLIKKGYENVKRFSWKKSAEKMLKIIEGVL